MFSLPCAPVKNETYLRLKVNFKMEKNDISKMFEEFLYILPKFSNLEARWLEVKFLKNLDSKIPVGPKCFNEEWEVSI